MRLNSLKSIEAAVDYRQHEKKSWVELADLQAEWPVPTEAEAEVPEERTPVDGTPSGLSGG